MAFHLLTLRNWGPRFAATAGPWRAVSTTVDGATQTAFAAGVRQVWDFFDSPGAASSVRFAVALFYLLGAAAAIYHFANGLWTGAMAWGLPQSASSQRRSLWAFTAFGIALLVLGAMGWYAFLAAPWVR